VNQLLKVDSIKFTDSKNKTYYILNNQIELFPIIGGEESNMITTQVWNQQGNTHINSLIEPYEGEIIFILYTRNRQLDEIEAGRRILTNMCNPLNGTVKMTVTLNNGAVYNRDIVFNSAPLFPVGIENRNRDWQKVQLLYTANNPFWYEETEIIESFQASEPLFKLPFTMSASSPVILGNIAPSKAAVNNGQAEAPLTIEITGACVNPKITNETTGEFIAFKNLTMTTGQKLIINTAFGEKKVQLDGANVFHKLDFNSTFFSLAIGDNIINFTDDLGSPDASIIFKYKNLYVSI
jgi:hypothetical protein